MRASIWAPVAVCCLIFFASCDDKSCPVRPVYLDQITDLHVVDTTAESITLAWTAPLAEGENLYYDIRYREASGMAGREQFNETLWALADTAAGEPIPSHAGYGESYVLALEPSFDCFVAIRIVRESDGEMSNISNTVSASTHVVECHYPSLYIPDLASVSDVITLTQELQIEGIYVNVNITHTYIGDLGLVLTSPAGTNITLHNRSGGSSDNIIGTYGVNLTVDGPGTLDDFMGETSQGDWTLSVRDWAGGDVGTLNSWCLEFWGTAP